MIRIPDRMDMIFLGSNTLNFFTIKIKASGAIDDSRVAEIIESALILPGHPVGKFRYNHLPFGRRQ